MGGSRLTPLAASLLLAVAGVGTTRTVTHTVTAYSLPPAEQQAAAAASRWSGFWPSTAPPGNVPSNRAVDGPLLGNGDVGLVAGVKDGVLTFYICVEVELLAPTASEHARPWSRDS